MVALSTCEAEYIIGVLLASQTLWLMNLLQEPKFKVRKPVRLTIDNKSTIRLAKNPLMHERRKHIDTKYHFLSNQFWNGVLYVAHINTQKQRADVLTRLSKLRTSSI